MQGDSTTLFGDAPHKRCRKCGLSKALDEFPLQKCRLRSGVQRVYRLGWCKVCRRAYIRKRSAADKPRRERWYRRTKFGLTDESYAALLAKQGGVCAICGKPESKIDFRSKIPHALSIDHDHDSNSTRGLLCNTCNRGLGLFQDDPALLRAAISYLAAHGKS